MDAWIRHVTIIYAQQPLPAAPVPLPVPFNGSTGAASQVSIANSESQLEEHKVVGRNLDNLIVPAIGRSMRKDQRNHVQAAGRSDAS
jgi:hypothetical protein